mmetsp:Transcript_7155/g.17830  ORF Transcript_7155/g.17830 Transcript_7155/m.17830 type:complete len:218 (+) Transcript_7155:388-1041(+)
MHATCRHLVLHHFERHQDLLLVGCLLVQSHLLNGHLSREDTEIARWMPHFVHALLSPIIEGSNEVEGGVQLLHWPVINLCPLDPHRCGLAILRVSEKGNSVHTSQHTVDLPTCLPKRVRASDGACLARSAVPALWWHWVDHLRVVFVSQELELQAERCHLHLGAVPTPSSLRIWEHLDEFEVSPAPCDEILARLCLTDLALQLEPSEFLKFLPSEGH